MSTSQRNCCECSPSGNDHRLCESCGSTCPTARALSPQEASSCRSASGQAPSLTSSTCSVVESLPTQEELAAVDDVVLSAQRRGIQVGSSRDASASLPLDDEVKDALKVFDDDFWQMYHYAADLLNKKTSKDAYAKCDHMQFDCLMYQINEGEGLTDVQDMSNVSSAAAAVGSPSPHPPPKIQSKSEAFGSLLGPLHRGSSPVEESCPVVMFEINGAHNGFGYALVQLEVRLCIYLRRRQIKQENPNLTLSQVVAFAGIHILNAQREVENAHKALKLFHFSNLLEREGKFEIITTSTWHPLGRSTAFLDRVRLEASENTRRIWVKLDSGESSAFTVTPATDDIDSLKKAIAPGFNPRQQAQITILDPDFKEVTDPWQSLKANSGKKPYLFKLP